MLDNETHKAQYSNITIHLQTRQPVGFTFQFTDEFSGKILATEYTEETDLEKAKKSSGRTGA